MLTEAIIMNTLSKKLFACTAFPQNENRRIRYSKLFGYRNSFVQCRTFTNNIIKNDICHMTTF